MLYLFDRKNAQRQKILSLFPMISGAYLYGPIISGWVNTLNAKRRAKEWNAANILISACRRKEAVAAAIPGPTSEEGHLADGRRLFEIHNHGLSPREILLGGAKILIHLEGVEYGFVKLYSSEEIRLIHEVYGDDYISTSG